MKKKESEAKIPHYLQKITATARQLQLAPGVHIVQVRHDDWCSIWRGGECNCEPEIGMSAPGKN